jgi:hypothetical protein
MEPLKTEEAVTACLEAARPRYLCLPLSRTLPELEGMSNESRSFKLGASQ